MILIRYFYFVFAGVRELVRVTRKSEHNDLMNSAIGGLFSGALLGRLQGLLNFVSCLLSAFLSNLLMKTLEE